MCVCGGGGGDCASSDRPVASIRLWEYRNCRELSIQSADAKRNLTLQSANNASLNVVHNCSHCSTLPATASLVALGDLALAASLASIIVQEAKNKSFEPTLAFPIRHSMRVLQIPQQLSLRHIKTLRPSALSWHPARRPQLGLQRLHGPEPKSTKGNHRQTCCKAV